MHERGAAAAAAFQGDPMPFSRRAPRSCSAPPEAQRVARRPLGGGRVQYDFELELMQ